MHGLLDLSAKSVMTLGGLGCTAYLLVHGYQTENILEAVAAAGTAAWSTLSINFIRRTTNWPLIRMELNELFGRGDRERAQENEGVEAQRPAQQGNINEAGGHQLFPEFRRIIQAIWNLGENRPRAAVNEEGRRHEVAALAPDNIIIDQAAAGDHLDGIHHLAAELQEAAAAADYLELDNDEESHHEADKATVAESSFTSPQVTAVSRVSPTLSEHQQQQ